MLVPCRGTAPCGATRPSLPRPGGFVDRGDRSSAGTRRGNHQDVSLRSDWRKARAVKARYRGVCRGCGAPTAPRNGKGDAYAYCKRCHPGAIAPEWTRERVREAMRAWRVRYGAARSSYDWSRTHARRRGGDSNEYRPENGPHRPPSPICTAAGRRPAPTPSPAPERPGHSAVVTPALALGDL